MLNFLKKYTLPTVMVGWGISLWHGIRQEYAVRANIHVSGQDYAKFGTQFDTRLLVIDKTGPTTEPAVTDSVGKVSELPTLLEEIRNDRGTVAQRSADSNVVEQTPTQPEGEGDARPTATGGDGSVGRGIQPVRPDSSIQPEADGLDADEGTAGVGTGAIDQVAPTEGQPNVVRSGERDAGGVDTEGSDDIPDGTRGVRSHADTEPDSRDDRPGDDSDTATGQPQGQSMAQTDAGDTGLDALNRALSTIEKMRARRQPQETPAETSDAPEPTEAAQVQEPQQEDTSQNDVLNRALSTIEKMRARRQPQGTPAETPAKTPEQQQAEDAAARANRDNIVARMRARREQQETPAETPDTPDAPEPIEVASPAETPEATPEPQVDEVTERVNNRIARLRARREQQNTPADTPEPQQADTSQNETLNKARGRIARMRARREAQETPAETPDAPDAPEPTAATTPEPQQADIDAEVDSIIARMRARREGKL